MTRPRDIADSINRIDSSAADATAVTVDSSERVFIGNTNNDTNPASTGNPANKGATFGGASDPYLSMGRVGNAPLVLGRIDNDGDIIFFYSDGTAVGKINTQGGSRIAIGTGDTGLIFNESNDSIHAWNIDANTNRTDNIDFGNSSNRFKDLYLGGGAYIGGTASGNKLDDYEEGTFNPFTGVGSAFTGESTINAKYVKVGEAVHIDLRVSWTATDNSSNAITLVVPFTMTSQSSAAHTGLVFYQGTQIKSGAAISAHVGSSNSLAFYRTDGGNFETVRRNEVNGSYSWLVSFTYFTSE